MEDETLKNINKQIYDTYHDPKNKQALPIAIFWAVIVIIFKNPLLWEIIVWSIYYFYCSSNNQKLNKNKYNLEKRAFLLNFKQKYLNGDFENYKRL